MMKGSEVVVQAERELPLRVALEINDGAGYEEFREVPFDARTPIVRKTHAQG